MHLDGNLFIRAGQATDRGPKEINEDCMGLRIPEDPLLSTKGIVAVIADGVSSAEAGREASESCVQNFLSDYFATPESWTVKTSGQRVLTALNRWLYGQGSSYRDAARGYVTTLSILVAKSCTAHMFHVGDTRIYRLSGEELEQLTRDHSKQIGKDEAYLTRAMGMDVRLDIDYRAIDLVAGDCFLLSTDGVHDFLKKSQLLNFLRMASETSRDSEGLEKLCREMIQQARDAGSQDNLTCQLLRIEELPTEDAVDLTNKLTGLPFPPYLGPGMKIDGYMVEEEIYASSRSQVYRVIDTETGQELALKTPSVNFEDDPAYIERFVMEPWIGSRIDSPNVVKSVPNPRRQNFLYYLQEFAPGRTLEKWIVENPRPEIDEATDIIEGIATGLRALHLREVLHRDLKPGNIMVGNEGQVMILDFGSCFVAGISQIAAPIERNQILSTASYMAPELRFGQQAGHSSYKGS
jgi:serine/threonine protein phosphatase PrpC